MSKTENQKLIESIGLIGCSQELADVAETAISYCDGKENVLVTGEFGCETLKVAEAVHTLGAGNKKHLYKVDCREFACEKGIQRLVEFLFGVKAGSYPGATETKDGFLDRATQGTLIFEEIQELSVLCQNAISRFIDTKIYQRQGEWGTDRTCGARLVFTAGADYSAHLPLPFRSRLGVRIIVPPLRARIDDIEPLLNHFIDMKSSGKKSRFAADAIEFLKNQKWPANLLDLERLVENVVRDFSSQEVVTLDDLKARAHRPPYDFKS